MSHDDKLHNIRHSLAHLLAAAVMELWPETKRTIGPSIDNGFYFDFEFKEPISDSDLPKIEAKMREILPSWSTFERSELSAEQAKAEYPGNEYKHELIEEFSGKGETLTFYKSGSYWDLCRGGHVEDMKEIDPLSFKLDRVAGAYWRGDEKNKMLTRIYGLAFESEAALNEYLEQREQALARDHKKLGRELDLFAFSEIVGKGLPLWTDKGTTIRREIERFVVDEEIKRGYKHVSTPDIAKLELYEKSGHYPYYKESMYAPIEIDDEKFMLRPMTCPHHFELYLRRKHSYRELPQRIAELAQLYRYEQSGELSGLMRVRTFCLADAHIITTGPEQAGQEVNGALDLIEYIAETFGLIKGQDYFYRLSLGSRADDAKYYKDDEAWDLAESTLRGVIQKRDVPFVEAENEAAFYGPKIDIQMRNVAGKEDTAFTVQYDFVMPKRFNLTYIDSDGSEKEAVVVHRSSVGAIERIIAFLIEHYAGAFPVWLSPLQVMVLPISEKHFEYANEVANLLKENGIRFEIDERAESVGKKIREAEMQKIPYMIVVGEKESADKTVTVRKRGSKDQEVMSLLDFNQKIKSEIESKAK